jgi:hypothetical protein
LLYFALLCLLMLVVVAIGAIGGGERERKAVCFEF